MSDELAIGATDEAGGSALVQIQPGYKVAGKYVIKKLLGEGANGSVYEGEHGQIGHRVAIKIVHKSLAEREDILARFAREARICGTIRNRNVGQVYDVGELADGSPYMVMELHEGRSLAQVLTEDGPLPIGAIADIGRQLLLGLQAAHDTGVVHRDVKPDNIMLVRESSGQSVVKLVDFGIGKNVAADIRGRNVTQEGMVVGSPDYMPPEQLKGEEVDARVDVYAAGVVLYEAVTSRVPFNAGSLTELFVAILRDPVSAPRIHRPDCPVELERLILRAMSREAGERFQNAAEMRKALEAVQRNCGLGNDELSRYSQPPPPGARPHKRSSSSIAEGGYALETERVRTAELQIPVKRAGTRIAWVAAGLVMAGAGVVWGLRSTQDGSAHRVLPREPHAAAAAERVIVAPESLGSKPVPEPVGQAPTQKPAPEPMPAGVEPKLSADEGEKPAARVQDLVPAPGTANAEETHAGGRVVDKKKKRPGAATESSREAPKPASAATAPAPLPPAASAAPPAAAGLSTTELLQQAAAAFVRGQMPRARALYREATAKAPGHPDGWRGLGMVSSRMGEREEAARAFKRYLALRPDAADADAIRKKLAGL